MVGVRKAKFDLGPTVKPTHEDRKYFKWLKDHFDLCDVARGMPQNQHSNERVERHLNAGKDWRERLRKLSLREVALMRRGGQKLYLKPARTAAAKAITVRFDADAHHGETDATDLIHFIREKLGLGVTYQEHSERGHSGYLTLDIPLSTNPISGNQYFEKRERTNLRIRLVEASLKLLTAHEGFAAGIEVKGSYTAPAILDDGTRKLLPGCRGSMVKLPRCPNPGDIDRLLAARLPVSSVDSIIHSAYRLLGTGHQIDLSKPALKAAAVLLMDLRNWSTANVTPCHDLATPVATQSKLSRIATTKAHRINRGVAAKLDSTGDKHRDRCRAVSRAIKAVLGRTFDSDTVTDEQFSEIVDAANTIYEQSGLAGGERDTARDTAFRSIARRMIRSTDRRDTVRIEHEGDEPGWFGDEDVAAMDHYLRSKLPKNALEQVAADNKPKLNGAKITYRALAISLLTIAKNSMLSGGDVPSTSVSGMLRHLGIRSNGTHVRVLRDVLARLGLIEGNRCWTRGQAEKYRVMGKVLYLPCFIELKAGDAMRAAYEEQKDRLIQVGAGVGGAQTLDSSHDDYSHQSMWYTSPVPIMFDMTSGLPIGPLPSLDISEEEENEEWAA